MSAPLKLPGPSGLAAGIFERELPRLATALRRALPFLTRRAVPVSLGYARSVALGELQDALERPSHRVSLALSTGARGALFFDARALALLLDGVLGGDGRALPKLSPAGLTGPQGALVSRTAGGVVRALSEVLGARAGVQFEALPWSPEPPREDTPMVAAAFDLGDDPSPARVVLALPGEALEPLPQAPPPDASNERVARTLESVDLELVVELARVPMRLGDVLALRPGDTLPLDLPVGESVSVRADDRTLFRGKPTTLLGRIAVRIEGRHEG